MARVFVKREQAAKYSVAKGDTLAGIVAKKCEPGVSWQELARYNWATEVPEEVNRALIEIVGCSKVDPDPSKSVLDPALGTNAQILIPKIFKQGGLATDQTHTITVRKRLPAPAIRITKLDKWFIPGQESCDIDYALEGVKERADKVDFEVYASHYCRATAAAAGEFFTYSYTELDIPIRQRVMSGEQRPGTAYRIRGWKGESEATDGVLKPRQGGTRYINVAFSPYTVLLRYYKNEADRKARIQLHPFWVEFEKPAGSTAMRPKEASLRICWRVIEASKLKHGQIIIWDRDDRPVFRKALGAGDLSAGDHDYFWREGKTIAKPAGMPYRVQIQAHTDMHEDNGLALAAAHTEVRLWCDAGTGRDPANYWNDPTSLELALAPWLPPPEPPKDSLRAYKLRLARGGFHPGPIDEDAAREEFKTALREFQRSWPIRKAAAQFERLAAGGNLDQDTKNQLQNLPAAHRPLFGDPNTYTSLSVEQAGRRLSDPAQSLIVWVDDRHCYTGGEITPPDRMAMNNYRGAMDIGDQRVVKDRNSIARPWIPVEVSLPLLSKSDPLEPAGSPPRVTEAMRRAIGPIRVDWTFIELPQDANFVPSPSKSNHRARRWTQEIVKHNCPEQIGGADCGGIRPAALDTYYRAAFGFGQKDSLQPWLAYDDSGTKTVCSTVHDDLGQDANKLYADYVGKAGIYFRPSRIAGDGYVFCAQVSFKPLPVGGDFPNRTELERRYPKRPLARSAGLRVWRKASVRGYVGWIPTPQAGWQTTIRNAAAHYRPAYVHFVPEAGGAFEEFRVSDLLTPQEFKQIVEAKLNVARNPYQGLQAQYTAGYVWPYLHLPHYGINALACDLNTFGKWLADGFLEAGWRAYREALIHRLLKRVESKYGRLRGHLLVEFESSPNLLIVEATCDTCGAVVTEVVNDPTSAATDAATGIHVSFRYCGRPCYRRLCGGWLQETARTTKTLPLPAVGVSLGACWLFTGRRTAVWAHEIGHHRHLEHAQANAGSTDPAPGAKNQQHDSEANPHQAGAPSPHQRGWDRFCIMSYDSSFTPAFCGKCLLKNRGWAVETIANPNGNLEDP